MSNLAEAQDESRSAERKVRVMLVDDSAVVRGLMNRWLSAEDNIEVVSRCHNGLHAVREIKTVQPDIAILDIEMPEMDGLEALPLLLQASPKTRILIASSLSQRNAEISLTALSKGAHDYIPKPSTNSDLTTSAEFRVDLITKINALCVGSGGKSASRFTRVAPDQGAASQVEGLASPPAMRKATSATDALPTVSISTKSMSDTSVSSENLRKFNNVVPDILCIGSSTGGPRAVQEVLATVVPYIAKVPVVLTQHMPGTFTTVFASHLDKALPVPVAEAVHGEPLLPGRVYVAPGERHLMFKRGASGIEVVLDDGPQVNFCKPAVDNMFQSANDLYGKKILGVILTGMGQDGAAGGKLIADSGGNILVQDAESSIVWGMPGAAYKAGVSAGVFSLDEIGGKIVQVLQRGTI
ncbi:MAG: chemotaxis response regulator protein-glutamate methylesterase [Hyphomicrobiales bacterium]